MSDLQNIITAILDSTLAASNQSNQYARKLSSEHRDPLLGMMPAIQLDLKEIELELPFALTQSEMLNWHRDHTDDLKQFLITHAKLIVHSILEFLTKFLKLQGHGLPGLLLEILESAIQDKNRSNSAANEITHLLHSNLLDSTDKITDKIYMVLEKNFLSTTSTEHDSKSLFGRVATELKKVFTGFNSKHRHYSHKVKQALTPELKKLLDKIRERAISGDFAMINKHVNVLVSQDELQSADNENMARLKIHATVQPLNSTSISNKQSLRNTQKVIAMANSKGQ